MKRILFQLFLLISVAAVAVGVTRAYFSDQGASTNNTFAAGTLDLKLSDDNETVADSITESIGGSNMAPGGTPVTGIIKFRNSGTIVGHDLAIAVTNTCSATGMAKYLKLTKLIYGSNNLLTTALQDVNRNGILDLDDWASLNDGAGIEGLTLADLDVDHALTIGVQLDTSTPNTFQGQHCVVTIRGTLTQATPQ